MELDDAAQLTAALNALAHDPSQRDATLELLHASLNSKTLRDVEPDAAVYAALFEALHAAWSFFDDGALERVHAWLAGVLQLPEFSRGDAARAAAAPSVTPELVDAVLARLARPAADAPAAEHARGRVKPAGVSSAPVNGGGADVSAAQQTELRALQALLHWAYRELPPLRPRLRAKLGAAALDLGGKPLPPPGLRAILELVAAIVGGFGAPTAAHRQLLRDVLVPLHRPSGRVDEITPALSLYHEPLVGCVVLLARAQPALLVAALPPLLALWPEPREGNSAKEVLLLHELEQLVELVAESHRRRVCMLLAPLVGRCAGSENSRVAERALSLFANDVVRAVLLADYSGAAPLLLSALLRGGTPHWNATVNKMSHEVLSLMRTADADGFARAADVCFSNRHFDGLAAQTLGAAAPPAAANGAAPPPSRPCAALTGGSAPSAPPGHTPMRAPWAAAGAAAAAPPPALSPLSSPSPLVGGVAVPRAPVPAALAAGGRAPPRRFDACSRMPAAARPTAASRRCAPGPSPPASPSTSEA